MSLLLNSTTLLTQSSYNQQWVSYNSTSFYSTNTSNPRSRIQQNIDGSFEVAPYTLFEIIGSHFFRPAIDGLISVVKGGYTLLDRIIPIPFLPGVEAKENSQNHEAGSLKGCLEEAMSQSIDATQAAIQINDPRMMEAAHTQWGETFAYCFKDQTYQKIIKISAQYRKEYDAEVKKMDESFANCEETWGKGYCYTTKRHALPDYFEQDGEWKAAPGYISWKVYANKWFREDPKHAFGSLNYDDVADKPTVPSRKQI